MAGGMPNLRTMKVTTSSGKDVKNTQQLKGEATKTKAEGETNSTEQYYNKAPSKDSLGGENKAK